MAESNSKFRIFNGLNGVRENFQARFNRNYVLTSRSPLNLKKDINLLKRTIERIDIKDLKKLFEIIPKEMLNDPVINQNMISLISNKYNEYRKQIVNLNRDGKNPSELINEITEFTNNIPSELITQENSPLIGTISSFIKDTGAYKLKILQEQPSLNGIDTAAYATYRKSQTPDYLLDSDEFLLASLSNLDENERNSNINALINSGKFKGNTEFIEKFYTMLKEQNASKTSLESIKKQLGLLIKDPLMRTALLMEYTKIDDLKAFLEKNLGLNFYDQIEKSQEENQVKPKNEQSSLLNGKMKRLYDIVEASDPEIIGHLDSRFLDDKYKLIPSDRIVALSKIMNNENRTITTELFFKMDQIDTILFAEMTKLENGFATQNNIGRRIEEYALHSFSNGEFSDLLSNIKKEIKSGWKLQRYEIPRLVKAMSHGYNLYNIKTRLEMGNLKQIRDNNAQALFDGKDSEVTLNYDISEMLPIQKKQFAILMKSMDITLDEAKILMIRYGVNIDQFDEKNPNNSGVENHTISQLKFIKKVMECEDERKLTEIFEKVSTIDADRFCSALDLDEKSKALYSQTYKKDLFTPTKLIPVKDSPVPIYDAGTNFNMIVNKINGYLITDKTDYYSGFERAKSHDINRHGMCVSYDDQNRHNLFEPLRNNSLVEPVAFGFNKSLTNFIFNNMASTDIQSDMNDSFNLDSLTNPQLPVRKYADIRLPANITKLFSGKDISSLSEDIQQYFSSSQVTPELTLDKSQLDKAGTYTDIKPDYLIYYYRKGEKETGVQNIAHERSNEPKWQEYIRIAQKLKLPIVIVDEEKVEEANLAKVSDLTLMLKTKGKEKLSLPEKIDLITTIKALGENSYTQERLLSTLKGAGITFKDGSFADTFNDGLFADTDILGVISEVIEPEINKQKFVDFLEDRFSKFGKKGLKHVPSLNQLCENSQQEFEEK